MAASTATKSHKLLAVLLAMMLFASSFVAVPSAFATVSEDDAKKISEIESAEKIDGADESASAYAKFKFKDSSSHTPKEDTGNKAAYDAYQKAKSEEENKNKQTTQQQAITDNEKSFYTVGSAAANYLESRFEEIPEDSSDPLGIGGNLNSQWAGAFLGYFDKDKTESEGSTGFFSGSKAKNAKAVKLQLLSTDAYHSSSYGLFQYAGYGQMLSMMGFDKTNNDNAGALRAIAGGAMQLLYGATSGVEWIFSKVLELLNLLNPFNFLIGKDGGILSQRIDESIHSGNNQVVYQDDFGGGFGTEGGSTSVTIDESANAKSDWANDQTSPWGQIQSFLAQLLDGMYRMSWMVMVPIFIAVFLLTMVAHSFTKSWKPGSGADMFTKAKQLGIRILFIGLGLPILGGLYTSALTGLTEDLTSEAYYSNADIIVLQEFVDFAGWVDASNLSPVNTWQINYDSESNGVLTASLTKEGVLGLRNDALRVNDQANGLGLGNGLANDRGLYNFLISGDASIGDGDVWDKDSGGNGNVSQVAQDMLRRYSEGSVYSSMAYGGKAMSEEVQSSGGSDSDKKQAYAKWFEAASKSSNYTDSHWFDPNATPETPGDSGITWFTDGDLYSDGCPPDESYTKYSANGAKGLSTMSMFNYLNTVFEPGELNIYSAANSTSTYVNPEHYSVNTIGTGAYGVLLFLNSFVLLFSFAAIGWGYGIGLFISCIKRSVGLIAAIPFSILGAMGAITRVIVYVIALIVEIIATFFLYHVMCWLLMAFDRLITTIIPNVVMSGVGMNGTLNENTGALSAITFGLPIPSAGAPAILLAIACLAIVIMLLLGFTIMALRMRKTIVSAAADGITMLVERLTSASAGVSGGGGGGKGAIGALGSGLIAAKQLGKAGKAVAGGAAGGTTGGLVKGLAGAGIGAAAVGAATGVDVGGMIGKGVEALSGTAEGVEAAAGATSADGVVAMGSGGIEGMSQQNPYVESSSSGLATSSSTESYSDSAYAQDSAYSESSGKTSAVQFIQDDVSKQARIAQGKELVEEAKQVTSQDIKNEAAEYAATKGASLSRAAAEVADVVGADGTASKLNATADSLQQQSEQLQSLNVDRENEIRENAMHNLQTQNLESQSSIVDSSTSELQNMESIRGVSSETSEVMQTGEYGVVHGINGQVNSELAAHQMPESQKVSTLGSNQWGDQSQVPIADRVSGAAASVKRVATDAKESGGGAAVAAAGAASLGSAAKKVKGISSETASSSLKSGTPNEGGQGIQGKYEADNPQQKQVTRRMDGAAKAFDARRQNMRGVTGTVTTGSNTTQQMGNVRGQGMQNMPRNGALHPVNTAKQVASQVPGRNASPAKVRQVSDAVNEVTARRVSPQNVRNVTPQVSLGRSIAGKPSAYSQALSEAEKNGYTSL